MKECIECGEVFNPSNSISNKYCDECWDRLHDPSNDLGGTGHGDDSYSDADSGL